MTSVQTPVPGYASRVLTQTWAMLVDSYRELHSKKLFWITLALSFLVVAAFGVVGFNEQGITVFWKTIPSPFFNTTVLPLQELYSVLYIALGVNFWLAWLSIILALVSTAPLFPDFVTGGSIDLYLARPLSRIRLLLTKYCVGLLFVGLQVLVFSVAAFVLIGLRGGVWVPGVFLAVPLVVLMFSYLWSVCVLVGILTRSTVASLLITLLFWMLLFGVNATESVLLSLDQAARVQAEMTQREIANNEATLQRLTTQPAATQPGTPQNARRVIVEKTLDRLRKDSQENAAPPDRFTRWHRLAYAVKYPLPKTGETTDLIERSLRRQFRDRGEEDEVDEQEIAQNGITLGDDRVQREAAQRTNAIVRSRSIYWVLGTSLAFEGVVLAITAWIFCRRDY